MPYNGTKQSIFDVSVELFSQKGYDGVSLREISAVVGITDAAIYKHFENKEAILNAIFDTFKRKLNGYLLNKGQVDKFIETDTPRQLLQRCIGRFTAEDVQFMACAYRITYREHLVNQTASKLIISQLHEATAASVKYVLDSLIERGGIPAINTESFSMLWAYSTYSAAAIWVSRFFQDKELLEKSETKYAMISEHLVEMAISGKVL